MKGKGLKNAIAVSVLLFGLLVSLLKTGCDGIITTVPVCCPKIAAFKVEDPWVCPAHCPGGGKTRATFRVEFWKENEKCPPPNKVEISIKNLTDNVDLPPLTITNPGTGIYESTWDIPVTKDTDFELAVTGGGAQGCGTVSGKLRVDVVDEGDFHELCYSGPLSCTAESSEEHKGYERFGPGVLIDHVENLDALKVAVRKDNRTDHLPPYHPRGTGLSGLEANGDWAIWLKTEVDCVKYNARPGAAQKLCLKVYLQCECQ